MRLTREVQLRGEATTGAAGSGGRDAGGGRADLPPVLVSLVDSLVVNENEANADYQFLDTGFLITDAENDFDGGWLSVTGLLPEDRVTLVPDGQVTLSGSDVLINGIVVGTWVAVEGSSFTITFNAQAGAAVVTLVARRLAYSNASDAPTPLRDLTVTVGDTEASDSHQITVEVVPENDAPVLTGLPASVSFDENDVNAAPQLLFGDVTLTDPEANFDGGAVVVDGVLDEDEISIRHQGMDPGQIGFDADTGAVYFGGVLIGYAVGGCGCAPFEVMLNDEATVEAVEALIENITYANNSDAPTENRELTLHVFDDEGEAQLGDLRQFTLGDLPSVGDALASSDIVSHVFADLDDDGDLDLFVQVDNAGVYSGVLFENTGSAAEPMWNPVGAPLFEDELGDSPHVLHFVDIDGDGDLDLVAQSLYGGGEVKLLRNMATADDPMAGFELETDPALDHMPNDLDALLEFADLDGDGDLDMISGAFAVSGRYFENLGDGEFVERFGDDNPFAGLGLVMPAALRLGDIDGDGDLDLLTADYGYGYGVRYFENIGDASTPRFAERVGYANPFYFAPPALLLYGALDDINGDGFADMVLSAPFLGMGALINEAGPGHSIEVTVVAQDDPGVAADDAVTASETGVTFGSVFADNGDGPDSDPDGGPVVAAVNGDPTKVGAPILLASGALLTLNADGTFAYNPNGVFDLAGPDSGSSNTSATDSFTYTLAGGETATVTVTILGQDGPDTVLGTDGDDILNGGIGDDFIQGLGGDDILIGGGGADILVGGDGFDFASYANASKRVAVRLDTGVGWAGAANGDILAEIEGLIGSNFNDSFIGSSGDDEIRGEAGDDYIEGGGGADRLDGGDGVDTLSYYASDAAVSVDLALQTASGGHADGDVISGFENLRGSRHDDQILGSAEANHIRGEDGDDLIEGRGGADLLDGGEGVDTLSYASSGKGVEVRLWSGLGARGHAAGDQFYNFENILGSAYRDLLSGDGGDNHIWGGDGDDLLHGLDGDDILEGGDGDDVLYGGLGADILIGGAGVDTADYSRSDQGVDVRLMTGLGERGAAGDVLSEIENLTGSRLTDRLIGDGGDNRLSGEAGDDYLDGLGGDDHLLGGAGADRLKGGDGDDVLEGGAGADQLEGGDGFDMLSYAGSADGVTVRLKQGTASGGDAEGDVFSGVEGLVGSAHDDTLIGDEVANRLEGGEGDDYLDGLGGDDHLSGGAGADRLKGGAGDDLLEGGAGADLFIFAGASGADRILDFEVGTDRIRLDASVFADFGAVLAAATDDGAGNAVIAAGGVSITLEGVSTSELLAGDFEFVGGGGLPALDGDKPDVVWPDAEPRTADDKDAPFWSAPREAEDLGLLAASALEGDLGNGRSHFSRHEPETPWDWIF